MDLLGNHLSGTVPSAWVGLTQVSHAVWSTCTLPSWAADAAIECCWAEALLVLQVTWMDLSSNRLNGTLPSIELGLTQASGEVYSNVPCLNVLTSYSTLVVIQLSHVVLDTPLLMQLLYLNLTQNMLTGTLPDSWSQLTSVSHWQSDCVFAWSHCKCVFGMT